MPSNPNIKTCHRYTAGLNVADNPGDLPIGALTVATNVYSYGGDLFTRPGTVGLLQTPESYPIWNPVPFVDVNGLEWVIYATGTAGSTNGQIHFCCGVPFHDSATLGNTAWPLYVGSTGSNQFSTLGTFDASTFRCVRAGLCLYFCVGGVQYDWRIGTGLTPSSVSYYSEPSDFMIAPITAPSVQLTNLPFISTMASQWAARPMPPVYNWTTTTSTYSSGSTATIPVVSVYGFQAENQYIYVTDGTHVAHYIINSISVLNLSCTAVIETGDNNPTFTMGSGAYVRLADGGLLGNPYFDVGGGLLGSSTEAMGLPWIQTVPPYIQSSNSPDYGPSSNSTSVKHYGSHPWAMLLDNPPDSCQQTVYAPLNQADASSYPPINNLTRCAAFQLIFQCILQNSASGPGVTVQMNALTSGGQVVGTLTQTFYPQSGTSWQQFDAIFNFTDLPIAADPDHYVITFTSGPKNTGGNGVYIAAISLTPYSLVPATGNLTNSGTGDVNWIAPDYAVGGSFIVLNLGSGYNFTGSNIFGFAFSSQLPLADLNFTLGFVEYNAGGYSGATLYQTGEMYISSDNTFMYADVTAAIPTATLASVGLVYIICNQDIPISDFPLSPTSSSEILLSFGSIDESGNLSVNTLGQGFSPYVYASDDEASNPNGPADFTLTAPLYSAPSPISTGVTASGEFAVASIVLAPSLNTAANNPNSVADYQGIARAGGTYEDGLFRYLCRVPIGRDIVAGITVTDLTIDATNNYQGTSASVPFVSTSVGKTAFVTPSAGVIGGLYYISAEAGGKATFQQNSITNGIVSALTNASLGTLGAVGTAMIGGDNLVGDLSNPYIKWAHSTRTLTDNTPDSFLQFANVMQWGRSNPPTGISDIVISQNRIIDIVAQQGLVGWSLIDSIQSGSYFTVVDLSTDPSAAIKGAIVTVGYGDNDNIVSAAAMGSQLLFLKHRSAAILFGYDPTNFSDTTYLLNAGMGLAAQRALITCGATQTMGTVICFLSRDNVNAWNGDDPKPISLPIEPLLHPKGANGEPTISPTVFQGCAMMYYDQRLHVFAPTPNDTHNTTDYVYDFRYGCWTIWKFPVGMTSGASLTGANNGDNAYMGGWDGQLYIFAQPTNLTDLAYVSGDGATYTVVSSGSYNFTSKDVGQGLYMDSGTGWVPGIYPITGTGSNHATVSGVCCAPASTGGIGVLSAGGDKATPTSAASGLYWQTISRGMGQEQQNYSPSYEFGEGFMQPGVCRYVEIMGNFTAGAVLSVRCWMDMNPEATLANPAWTAPVSGEQSYIFPMGDGLRGQLAFVDISGTTILQQSVRGMAAAITKSTATKQ